MLETLYRRVDKVLSWLYLPDTISSGSRISNFLILEWFKVDIESSPLLLIFITSQSILVD